MRRTPLTSAVTWTRVATLCALVGLVSCGNDQPPDRQIITAGDAGSGRDAGRDADTTDATADSADAGDTLDIRDFGTFVPPMVEVAGTTPIEAIAVDVFADTACAVTTDAEIVCWGDRTFGAARVAPPGEPYMPTVVPFAGAPVFVAAGSGAACVLEADGAAWCWGENGTGILGNGTTDDATEPTSVAGSHAFDHIAVGTATACAIDRDGATWCWGSNSFGQLGDGSTVNSPVPVAVTGGLVFRHLDVGTAQVCGITVDDALYCWGRARSGGMGETNPAPVLVDPGPVHDVEVLLNEFVVAHADGRVTRWATSRLFEGPTSAVDSIDAQQVAFGYFHTCGLEASGTVKCWGGNEWGQLGNRATADSMTPVIVAGGHTFSALAAGEYFSCALSSDQQVLCWGQNRDGQLGFPPDRITPVQVQADVPFAQLSAGSNWTCGRTEDGEVYCWGQIRRDELREYFVNLAIPHISIPTKVDLPFAAAGVTTGALNACAWSAEGAVACWGDNTLGQLGAAVPSQFVATGLDDPTPFDLVEAGLNHVCGITAARGVKCWGYRFSDSGGIFGDTRWEPIGTLVDVGFEGAPQSLAVGSNHQCILADAKALCWGSSDRGQLLRRREALEGNNPKPAETEEQFKQLSVGIYHTCGLTLDGTTLCWGADDRGQLGDSSSTDYPRLISAPRFSSIGSGEHFNCGLDGDGTAWCWGQNFYDDREVGGMLGIGNREDTRQVSPVLFDQPFVALEVGWHHACALTDDDRAWCWGSNWTGQLGQVPQPRAVSLPD